MNDTKQPEALRLARELEGVYPVNIQDQEAAAAELRRLHIENEAQKKVLRAYMDTISQFHHAVADAGWHPGRTDDLLTDVIRSKGEELRCLHAANMDCMAWYEAIKADYEALRKAVVKLHAARGRYHTQLAACDLYDLLGLKNERPTK